MAAWLVKQEPTAYPFAQLVADGRTCWDGVRNAQARLHLRAMREGDDVLYYHTGDEKAVVGTARVARAAYPDPSDADWSAVDLVPVAPLARPVTLAQMRADDAFAGFVLLTHARLSVMPVEAAHLRRILDLGGPVAARGPRRRKEATR
jgi:predicted RNA-binding protein with PUA-like domain